MSLEHFGLMACPSWSPRVWSSSPIYDSASINQPPCGRPSSPPSVTYTHPTRNVDFLNLRGDFYWLESTGYIHEINEDHAQAKLYNGFARLQVQVSNLGFALPGTFVRFMNLRTLRDRSAPELMNRTEPLREVSFRILYGLADSEALRCAYAGWDLLAGSPELQASYTCST
jgi:hypothetical protein